ncbi:MAG TPA: hypothetical protein PKW95_02085 [bacterium]|nr:hypothetical protein [bacterium]
MRVRLWLIILALMLTPALAWAGTDARCGLSFGIAGGPAVNTDTTLKDEFNVPAVFELETKYYLWKPISLAFGLGYIYAEGKPKHAEWHGDWLDFNDRGTSFWRAGTFNLISRVEIGRYWLFNPYLGGGGGGVYSTMWRRGTVGEKKLSDSYDEWMLDYFGLVGFDFLFADFFGIEDIFALKVEGRWSFMPSNDSFTDERDLGLWTGLIGLQIYL